MHWLKCIFTVDSQGRLFTRGLTKIAVLRNQWASGFLYKRFDYCNKIMIGPLESHAFGVCSYSCLNCVWSPQLWNLLKMWILLSACQNWWHTSLLNPFGAAYCCYCCSNRARCESLAFTIYYLSTVLPQSACLRGDVNTVSVILNFNFYTRNFNVKVSAGDGKKVGVRTNSH